MVRKQRKNKKRKQIVPAGINANVKADWSDSEDSVTTHVSGFTNIGTELNDLNLESHDDSLSEVLVSLTERRSDTRLEAFTTFNELLCRMCCKEWLENNYDNVTKAVAASLKRSCCSELVQECVLACRSAGLIALSIDHRAADYLFRDVWQFLHDGIFQNSHKSAIASICTCLNTFLITRHDADQIEGILEFLHAQFSDESKDDNYRAQTLRSWMVALSTVPDKATLLEANVHLVLDLMDIMESTDCVPLRIAAAECIAMFYDLEAELGDNADLEEETGLSKQMVVETFHGYSGERRGAPKNDLKGQRLRFRILAEFLENDTIPEINFNIRREKCAIEGLIPCMHIECLRKVLKGGFQVHIIDNLLIQSQFGLTSIPRLLERRKNQTRDQKHYEQQQKQVSKKEWQRSRAKARNEKSDMLAGDF